MAFLLFLFPYLNTYVKRKKKILVFKKQKHNLHFNIIHNIANKGHNIANKGILEQLKELLS
jgi:hypothetical protein